MEFLIFPILNDWIMISYHELLKYYDFVMIPLWTFQIPMFS